MLCGWFPLSKAKKMVIDYDSGTLLEDNLGGDAKVEVQRKCRFVFVK